MSKIGKVNLELQEQAEELGFESVQEALDNGYTVIMLNGNPQFVQNFDVALEEAHQDYLHHKQIIINNLEMLMADAPYKVYKDTLQDAINFLKEGEV